jgi:hypothetical protein
MTEISGVRNFHDFHVSHARRVLPETFFPPLMNFTHRETPHETTVAIFSWRSLYLRPQIRFNKEIFIFLKISPKSVLGSSGIARSAQRRGKPKNRDWIAFFGCLLVLPCVVFGF